MKTEFGIPPHIQKMFSEKLKQEIIEGKSCGSTQFFLSPYLGDVMKELLKNDTEYYRDAAKFLKNQNEGRITTKDFENWDFTEEEKKIALN